MVSRGVGTKRTANEKHSQFDTRMGPAPHRGVALRYDQMFTEIRQYSEQREFDLASILPVTLQLVLMES